MTNPFLIPKKVLQLKKDLIFLKKRKIKNQSITRTSALILLLRKNCYINWEIRVQSNKKIVGCSITLIKEGHQFIHPRLKKGSKRRKGNLRNRKTNIPLVLNLLRTSKLIKSNICVVFLLKLVTHLLLHLI